MKKFLPEEADEMYEQLNKAYTEEDQLRIRNEIRTSNRYSTQIKMKYKNFFSFN